MSRYSSHTSVNELRRRIRPPYTSSPGAVRMLSSSNNSRRAALSLSSPATALPLFAAQTPGIRRR